MKITRKFHYDIIPWDKLRPGSVYGVQGSSKVYMVAKDLGSVEWSTRLVDLESGLVTDVSHSQTYLALEVELVEI